jgi:uncharacterized membrane protein
MWQIFTIAALVFNAAETTADKVIMVANDTLDTMVASFYRNLVFLILSLIVGITGLVGAVQFRLEWPLVLVAILELIGSIFYTILLKRVEMTGAAAIGYIAPFLFLLVDVFIVRAPLDTYQILGILLLIIGGVIFVIDPLTRRLKSQYTKYILAILLFDVITAGVQYYVFKYYAVGQNLNEISYMVSVWFWVTLGLLAMVIVSKKAHLLYKTATHNHYLQKIVISKSFDVGSALLWFHALSLATVSQVNSFSSFEPLILLAILLITQQVFKFKAGEDFTKINLLQKMVATGILVIGAWLAS